MSHPKEPEHDDAEDDADENENGDINENAGGHSILPSRRHASEMTNRNVQIWSSSRKTHSRPHAVFAAGEEEEEREEEEEEEDDGRCDTRAAGVII